MERASGDGVHWNSLYNEVDLISGRMPLCEMRSEYTADLFVLRLFDLYTDIGKCLTCCMINAERFLLWASKALFIFSFNEQQCFDKYTNDVGQRVPIVLNVRNFIFIISQQETKQIIVQF